MTFAFASSRPKAPKIYCFFSISRNVLRLGTLKGDTSGCLSTSAHVQHHISADFRRERRKYGKSVMCEIIYEKNREKLYIYMLMVDGKDMNIFATFSPLPLKNVNLFSWWYKSRIKYDFPLAFRLTSSWNQISETNSFCVARRRRQRFLGSLGAADVHVDFESINFNS